MRTKTVKLGKSILSVALTLMIMLSMVTVGIISANAGVGNGNIYFDNAAAKWDKVYLFLGHNGYLRSYEMTKVAGEPYIYQFNVEGWSDANGFYFAGSDGGVSAGASDKNMSTPAANLGISARTNKYESYTVNTCYKPNAGTGTAIVCETYAFTATNKTNLQKAILLAQAEGESNEKGYTQESWDAMRSALSAAVSVYNSGNVTQTMVDNAESALSQALSSLEYASVPPTDVTLTGEATALVKQEISLAASAAVDSGELSLETVFYLPIEEGSAEILNADTENPVFVAYAPGEYTLRLNATKTENGESITASSTSLVITVSYTDVQKAYYDLYTYLNQQPSPSSLSAAAYKDGQAAIDAYAQAYEAVSALLTGMPSHTDTEDVYTEAKAQFEADVATLAANRKNTTLYFKTTSNDTFYFYSFNAENSNLKTNAFNPMTKAATYGSYKIWTIEFEGTLSGIIVNKNEWNNETKYSDDLVFSTASKAYYYTANSGSNSTNLEDWEYLSGTLTQTASNAVTIGDTVNLNTYFSVALSGTLASTGSLVEYRVNGQPVSASWTPAKAGEYAVTAIVKDGYTATAGGNYQTAETNAITVTVNPVAYEINVQTNLETAGAATVNGVSSITYQYGEDEYDIVLKAVPAEGYRFVNWTNNVDGTVITDSEVTVVPSSSITYTANFVKTYTVTASSDNSAKGTAGASQSVVDENGTVTLTAAAKTGAAFDYWVIDGVDTTGIDLTAAEISFAVTGNVTAVAYFRDVQTYTVAVSAVNGTAVCQQLQDGVVEEGAHITVTATPKSDKYTLDYWTVNGEQVDETSTTLSISNVQEDLAIIAVFKFADYTVTFSGTNGTVTAYNAVTGEEITSGASVPKGTQVMFAAAGDTGYTFSKWEGYSNSVNNYLTVTVESDITLSAVFAAYTEGEFYVRGSMNTWGTTKMTYDPVNNYYYYIYTAAANDMFKISKSTTSYDYGGVNLLSTKYLKNNANDNKNAQFISAGTYAIIFYAGTTKIDALPVYSASASAAEGFTAEVSQATVISGNYVTFKTQAVDGYKFVGWQNAAGVTVSTAMVYAAQVTENLSLTAVFEEDVRDIPVYYYKDDTSYVTKTIQGVVFADAAKLADSINAEVLRNAPVITSSNYTYVFAVTGISYVYDDGGQLEYVSIMAQENTRYYNITVLNPMTGDLEIYEKEYQYKANGEVNTENGMLSLNAADFGVTSVSAKWYTVKNGQTILLHTGRTYSFFITSDMEVYVENADGSEGSDTNTADIINVTYDFVLEGTTEKIKFTFLAKANYADGMNSGNIKNLGVAMYQCDADGNPTNSNVAGVTPEDMAEAYANGTKITGVNFFTSSSFVPNGQGEYYMTVSMNNTTANATRYFKVFACYQIEDADGNLVSVVSESYVIASALNA